MLIPLIRGTEGVNKGIILALSLFITLPVAAQTPPTVDITATNNNGDRDSTWPGLQVNEGDTVTISITPSTPVTSGIVFYNSAVSGSLTPGDINNILGNPESSFSPGISNGDSFSFGAESADGRALTLRIRDDGLAEADETLTITISNLRAQFGNTQGFVLGTDSVTVTVRGTDTAPAFRDSVTAKVFPNDMPINLTIPEATGGNGPVSYTTTNLPAGLSFQGACGNRTLCGTPTTLGTTTIEITAADADMHTTGDTDILSFDLRIADAYRLTDLNQDGSLDDTDAFNLFRAYLRIPNVDATISQRATDWKDNGSAQGGDLNSDRSINQNDALIMYYAYRFGALLDNHPTLRQLLLNGVRGQMPDTDATYRELLRRARGLR